MDASLFNSLYILHIKWYIDKHFSSFLIWNHTLIFTVIGSSVPIIMKTMWVVFIKLSLKTRTWNYSLTLKILALETHYQTKQYLHWNTWYLQVFFLFSLENVFYFVNKCPKMTVKNEKVWMWLLCIIFYKTARQTVQ